MKRAEPIDLQAERCALNPREPRHWAKLAQLCLRAGRAAEAVAAAERALALAPRLRSAMTTREAAIKVLEASDPSLAVMELTAAARPGDPEMQVGLGRYYLDLDRPA